MEILNKRLIICIHAGHKVVSRHEALTLARSLQCDLVEVVFSMLYGQFTFSRYHASSFANEVIEEWLHAVALHGWN